MHYVRSEAIEQLICAFIFTCAKKNRFSHDAAHIKSKKKTLGRPEIVNIICTFNLSKSANRGCHSQETAYVVVATKMLYANKKDTVFKHSS